MFSEGKGSVLHSVEVV